VEIFFVWHDAPRLTQATNKKIATHSLTLVGTPKNKKISSLLARFSFMLRI
jgi:hypothetical protein